MDKKERGKKELGKNQSFASNLEVELLKLVLATLRDLDFKENWPLLHYSNDLVVSRANEARDELKIEATFKAQF